MIFVAGASGNVGNAVVQQLARGGFGVRAFCRKPGEQQWPDGVEAVSGDLNDVASISAHLDGVDAIFMMPGYAGGDELMKTLAGVERVVLLSANSAVNDDLENVVARYHVLSERAVRDSGAAWTILRPVSFMTNTLQWVPQLGEGDEVHEPFADVSVAVIDPHDIARVAVTALTNDGHAEQTYRLTGPAPLLPADRARLLGEALGRNLQFIAQADDDARIALKGRMEPPYIDAFFDFFRSGNYDEATISTSVEDVTGRAPVTFAEWARNNAAAFQA